MSNYYSQYIPQYGKLALPLTNLCKKAVPWKWDSLCQSAFEAIRDCLCSHPLLLIPDLGPDQTFVLETDASNAAVGAILQ